MGLREAFVLSILAAIAAAPCFAATISTDASSTVVVNTINSPPTDRDTDIVENASGTVTSTSFSAGSGNISTSSSASFASANAQTGEIKTSVNTSHSLTPPVTAGGAASGYAISSITENFTVSGTGTLSASMLVDVVWDVVGSYQVQAKVLYNGVFQDALQLTAIDGASGSFDDMMLTIEIPFFNVVSQTARIQWSLLTQILGSSLSGDSFIDATNTATIWIETTDGLIATPSDSSFLSNAVYPADLANTPISDIPLPASGFLLAAGIMSLRVRRRVSVTK